MTSIRHLTTAAAALAALALFAPASSAEGASSQVLSRTTVLTTSSSGTADVFLTTDATLSSRVDHNPDVRISGAGRLVGLWLEPLDGGSSFLASYRVPEFAGGGQSTYGSGRQRTCTGVPHDTLPLSSDCTGVRRPARYELARGRYRLTVLTDGKPVRLTLHLAGPAGGRRQIRLDQLASTQRALPAIEQTAERAVTFGGAADLRVPVQTFTFATVRFSKDAIARSASSCARPDAGTTPLAFGPACPGGTAGGFSSSLSVAGYESGFAHGFASSASDEVGPVGIGGSFGDSGGLAFGQALGIWFERPELARTST